MLRAPSHAGPGTDRSRELLLKAIVLQDRRALQAWQTWQAAVDEADLDENSHRLLPMLHENLSRLGVAREALTSYKQVYQFYWYRNQFILGETARLLQSLAEARISCAVLKGVALTTLYYPKPGLRPLGDVDILVKRADAARTFDALLRSGYVALTDAPDELLFKYLKEKTFRNKDGVVVDLHWDVLTASWPGAHISELWASLQPLALGSMHAKTLSTTDHFWHACLHGADWSFGPPIRWAVDAMMLLRKGGATLDWERSVRIAQDRRLTIKYGSQLRFLRDVLELEIPDEVWKLLASSKTWRWERAEAAASLRRITLPRKLIRHWFRHCRSNGERALIVNLLSFPTYLRATWAVRQHRLQGTRAMRPHPPPIAPR